MRSLVDYVREQRAVTRLGARRRELVLEHFRDEVGAVAHRAARAVRRPRERAVGNGAGAARARCAGNGIGNGRARSIPVRVQVQTTDDGIMLRLPDLAERSPSMRFSGSSADEAERRVLDEVGSTSLFGARFRMNAARALLLPRGNPRRRMPLWLQRLKALDLLQTVQEFPSFPILVETYRDVLQDAFDMPALATRARRPSERRDPRARRRGRSAVAVRGVAAVRIRDGLAVRRRHAARRAAGRVSVARPRAARRGDGRRGRRRRDHASVDEVLGASARHRAESSSARTPTSSRCSSIAPATSRSTSCASASPILTRWTRGDPLADLLASRASDWHRASRRRRRARGATTRLILTETFARYAAAFGWTLAPSCMLANDLVPRPAADVVPAALREPALSRGAARREILARWLTLSGPVSVDEIRARYDFPESWIAARLEEWQREGKLVRGFYGSDRSVRAMVLAPRARARPSPSTGAREATDHGRRSPGARGVPAALAASRSARSACGQRRCRRRDTISSPGSCVPPRRGSATICRPALGPTMRPRSRR